MIRPWGKTVETESQKDGSEGKGFPAKSDDALSLICAAHGEGELWTLTYHPLTDTRGLWHA